MRVQKIHESNVELLDQSAGFNANAEWVNMKGELPTARSWSDAARQGRRPSGWAQSGKLTLLRLLLTTQELG